MKKVIIILISILLLGGFVTLLVLNLNKNKPNEEYKYYHEINYQEFTKKINNKDSFVLVIHQTGCSHCINYLPIVKEVTNDYKVDIYSINTAELSEKDNMSFNNDIHFTGTPTTIFITDGEEKTSLNRIVGEASSKKIVERLKSLGFID